jgi:hypothetical protein
MAFITPHCIEKFHIFAAYSGILAHPGIFSDGVIKKM